ncbi:hypothetical protein [Microbacterium sp. NPDC087592]|uniref:hypothetical protein n=1 Tax=Microbacterium sp. NPDC087592 TaxID=3364193 RepID=UPI00382B40C0
MTDEVMKRVPENAPDWTLPEDIEVEGAKAKGLPRRTVLVGAAWSVPVISAAIATPLAAASVDELELTFVDGPYQAIACGPLDDIVVRATRGGAPAPGEPITVTLPAGLTWSDGTTTPRTLVSDANGEVVLSGVLAGNANGNYALGATSGAATAASTAEVQGADRGVISHFGGLFLPQLPAGVLIEDVQTNTNANGSMQALVRGSDGHVYISQLPAGSTTWPAWTRSSSPLAGSIEHLAVSKNGATNVAATTTTVSLMGAGSGSTPLPGGVTIVEVESYTNAAGGAVAVVLGSDGRAYTNTFANGAWSGWAAAASITGGKHVAVSESNPGSVVASDTTVSQIGVGANQSPVLPNGATIVEITSNLNAAGQMTVSVLGSDGRAYTNARTASGWGAWTASPSSINGSITHLAMSHTGQNTFIATDTRVGLYGNAGGLTPPLPNGATIVDLQGTTNFEGVPQAVVLGSDGRAYVSEMRNGAWTAWRPSRVGQGNLEHLAVSEGQGWTLVAGNPLC